MSDAKWLAGMGGRFKYRRSSLLQLIARKTDL